LFLLTDSVPVHYKKETQNLNNRCPTLMAIGQFFITICIPSSTSVFSWLWAGCLVETSPCPRLLLTFVSFLFCHGPCQTVAGHRQHHHHQQQSTEFASLSGLLYDLNNNQCAIKCQTN